MSNKINYKQISHLKKKSTTRFGSVGCPLGSGKPESCTRLIRWCRVSARLGETGIMHSIVVKQEGESARGKEESRLENCAEKRRIET
jgi:hypothetical protein